MLASLSFCSNRAVNSPQKLGKGMVGHWRFEGSFGRSRGLNVWFLCFIFFLYVGILQLQQAEGTFELLVCRLPIAGATAVAEHRLWSTGSVLVLHGLSCCEARGILPYQGSNPGPGALAGRLFTTAPPGKFYSVSFNWALCMLIHCQTKLGSSTNNWEI